MGGGGGWTKQVRGRLVGNEFIEGGISGHRILGAWWEASTGGVSRSCDRATGGVVNFIQLNMR